MESNRSSPVRDTESPTIGFSERRSFIRNNIPEEVRLFRRILNKITNEDRTYEGYLDNILKINVIEPDSPPENDSDIMKSVVSSFLGMIYEDKETNNNISLYGRLFIDLTQRWSGRQGRVLLSTMVSEINNFIKEYLEHKIKEEDMIEDIRRRRCFCIIKFLHYIYDKNSDVIPGKIIMIIMEKFFPGDDINELHLEVFLRLLSQNYPKLKNEKIFQVKLKDKYKKFLDEKKDNTFSSRQYNYTIEDILKLF
jgi:hypothetical protein